jgi:hypothetical protein
MGLKGAGPYFQRSKSNTVLAGLVYRICKLYIDDVLIHGKNFEIMLANARKLFERLRKFNVAVNPKKTNLERAEVEYIGHVVSTTVTSFTILWVIISNIFWECDTSVRTEYVKPVTSPVSHLTQTSFTTHSVQYIQYSLSVQLSLL